MKRKTLFSLVLGLLLLLPVVGTALAAPVLPAGFYGTVTVNGANVADGTEVTAWVNGTQYGATTTLTWNGDSVYAIDVLGDDPNTTAVEGAVAGETIVFKVDGQDAEQTATWQTGSSGELNLTVIAGGGNPPVANFDCTPPSPQPSPLTISCTDASTGDITDWLWDFGDGTTSTDQNPTHTYNDEGTYTVSLTVTGPNGSDTETKTDYVVVGVTDVCVPLPGSNVCINVISAGQLAVEWNDVIFPDTTVAGTDVRAHAIDATWTAIDTTQLGAGWHIQLQALDHLRGSGDPTNRVIPVGSSGNFGVVCLSSQVTPVPSVPNAGDRPTCVVDGPLQPVPNAALSESPITILTADVNHGMGAYDFVPHFQLLVPGTAVLDLYSTNIYVDINQGP